MILTGQAIRTEWAEGRIDIRPFKDSQINPNSYNFCLGRELKLYKETLLDAHYANEMQTVTMDDGGYILRPGRVYLGHTAEIMGSDHYVPIIRGRSSVARLGLFVHVTADLIDIGSHNQWTLQLHAVQSVRVYPGMAIGQVTFWKVAGEIQLYDGKYQGSMGPAESRLHLDFEDATAGVEWEEAADGVRK